MILEEINGDVEVTIIKQNGQTVVLVCGDEFNDHESSTLSVAGQGMVIVRVDANCTFEVKGVVAEAEAEVEVTPIAEAIPVAVKTPVVVKETFTAE
jgi:hypothetical protein